MKQILQSLKTGATEVASGGKLEPMNLWRQDNGQKVCAAGFMRAIEQGTPAPIPLDEIL